MTQSPLSIDLARDFADVRTWVFDLDNTLYSPDARLFDQIEPRISGFMMERLGLDRAGADRLRAEYFRDHGTTLAGLMRLHGLDPAEYLAHVHEIDLAGLHAAPRLAARIGALPGRRIVFTNGSAAHADRVLEARVLAGGFDAIYATEHALYRAKPLAEAFETVFAHDGFDRTTGAMFEDDPRNLAVPHSMGLRTVHVAPHAAPAPYIHHHTADLEDFLGRVV